MLQSTKLHKNLDFILGVAYESRLLPIDAAKNAAQNGYSHFYINTGKNILSETVIAELKAICHRLYIRPIIHGNWRNEIASSIAVNREKACADIFTEIEIAEQLSAPLIVHGTIDAVNRYMKYDSTLALNDFNISFEIIYQYAAKKNVEIWLENLPSNEAAVFTSDEQYKLILDKYPNVKFIYDIGHGNVGHNPIATFDAFHKHIVALSISDNDGTSDTHGALGSGSIDFYTLLKHIQIFEWRGIVIFDMHNKTAIDGINYLEKMK